MHYPKSKVLVENIELYNAKELCRPCSPNYNSQFNQFDQYSEASFLENAKRKVLKLNRQIISLVSRDSTSQQSSTMIRFLWVL